MAKISLPKTRKGWAMVGGGALGLGALFFAATSLMDGDETAPRAAPEASSSATPPAPVAPPAPSVPVTPVVPTTYFNITERAGPVALFVADDKTSEVQGYILGCYSTNDPEGELRDIKIVTPDGERTGFINPSWARQGGIVRNTEVTAAECTGTIMAAEDVPITEGFYRMTAGANILRSPWNGSEITASFGEAICLKIVDATNPDNPNFAQVYTQRPDRRIPYTGWARYSSLVIDEHCRPQEP